MKPHKPLSELSLLLQEARRLFPDIYDLLSEQSGIPAKRIKAIAYGEEPNDYERNMLERLARG